MSMDWVRILAYISGTQIQIEALQNLRQMLESQGIDSASAFD